MVLWELYTSEVSQTFPGHQETNVGNNGQVWYTHVQRGGGRETEETLHVCSWTLETHLHIKSTTFSKLINYFYRHKLDVVSCGKNVSRVQKTICSGFFRNAARKVKLIPHTITFHPQLIISYLYSRPGSTRGVQDSCGQSDSVHPPIKCSLQQTTRLVRTVATV